ncbi:hypothetical protein D3C85_1633600 [compost metagenome]
MPASAAGKRWDVSTSWAVIPLIAANSSLVAMSPTGISLMPSGLPSGMLTNMERKFPTPLLLAIISFISSSVSSSMFGSVA